MSRFDRRAEPSIGGNEGAGRRNGVGQREAGDDGGLAPIGHGEPTRQADLVE
jgi:hypothetical protein